MDHFLLVRELRRAHDLDGLGGVGEGQPGGHSGDLQGPPFAAPMAAVTAVAGDRDITPGQGLELGVQTGLVALDREDVMRAPGCQVADVLTLGVHRIGGDDHVGQLDSVQQQRQPRDLVGLGPDIDLPQDQRRARDRARRADAGRGLRRRLTRVTSCRPPQPAAAALAAAWSAAAPTHPPCHRRHQRPGFAACAGWWTQTARRRSSRAQRGSPHRRQLPIRRSR